MPLRVFRSHALIGFVVALAAYFPVLYVAPRDFFIEAVAGLLVCASMVIFLSHLPGVYYALRQSRQARPEQLYLLGNAAAFFFIVCLFSWAWFYRIFDRPTWMVDHWGRGFLIWGVTVSAIMLQLAAGADEREVMVLRNWRRLSLVIVSSLFITSLLLSLVGGEPK